MTDDRPRVPRPPSTRRNTPLVDPPRTPPWLNDPAAISQIEELVEQASIRVGERVGTDLLEQAIAAFEQVVATHDTASETKMGKQVDAKVKRKTRPIQLSLVGVLALFGGTCTWFVSKWDDWETNKRKQWELEQKQDVLDQSVIDHLTEPHASPQDIKAMNDRLIKIEMRLGEVSAKVDNLATVPTKTRK